VLLRRPYGRRSDPVALPGFEEFIGRPDHEQLLWGPGSLAVGLLLAQGFAESGWAFEPGEHLQLDDLPQCTYEEDGEAALQACAETYLSNEAGQSLLSAGLMPLLSHRQRNAVRLMRLQSLAQPPQPLAGLSAKG
jgi:predicted component of type VI protein secretion system